MQRLVLASLLGIPIFGCGRSISDLETSDLAVGGSGNVVGHSGGTSGGPVGGSGGLPTGGTSAGGAPSGGAPGGGGSSGGPALPPFTELWSVDVSNDETVQWDGIRAIDTDADSVVFAANHWPFSSGSMSADVTTL